jgi:NAD(P)-dependent dehydrogenase (short-subunit alcohol dehydrogenase family)
LISKSIDHFEKDKEIHVKVSEQSSTRYRRFEGIGAAIAKRLASDAARWITGASIPVDGGSKL